jgi:galactokinase
MAATNILQFPAQSQAQVQSPGTINLVGPSTSPGAAPITPAAINLQVNAALATKANASTVATAGTTAARPVGAPLGWAYFDTTIGVPIWWNGSGWVNSTGGAV